MDKTRPATRTGHTNRVAFLFAGLLLLAFPVARQALFDLGVGGDPWQQGDWLINLNGGHVRRGLFGEAVIRLSDALGSDLLVFVMSLQYGLATFAIALLCLIWRRISSPRMMLLLMFCPAFFVFFWAGSPGTAVRKEMFVILSLLLLVLATLNRHRADLFFALAVLFMSAGAIGHEVVAIFAPVFLAATILVFSAGMVHSRVAVAGGGLVLLISGVSLIYSISHRTLTDLEAICLPLLERGMAHHMCLGALSWVVYGSEWTGMEMETRLTFEDLAGFFVMVGLCVVWCLAIAERVGNRRLLLALLGISLVCALPLYVVAIDWGRWLSLSMTCFALLVLMAISIGRMDIRSEPGAGALATLGIVSFFASPYHIIGIRLGGAAYAIWVFGLDLIL